MQIQIGGGGLEEPIPCRLRGQALDSSGSHALHCATTFVHVGISVEDPMLYIWGTSVNVVTKATFDVSLSVYVPNHNQFKNIHDSIHNTSVFAKTRLNKKQLNYARFLNT